jgi:hypothetical protein
MASSDGVRDPFAPPRVLAADGGEPGELLLRSAGELGEYPVTVLHSLREWAGIAPEYSLISERARGDWRTVSYGARSRRPTALGRCCSIGAPALAGRCWCSPATAWTTCW